MAVGVGVSGIVVDVSVGGGEVAEGGTGVCVGKGEGEARGGDSAKGVGVSAQPATNPNAIRVASIGAIRRRRSGEKPGRSISDQQYGLFIIRQPVPKGDTLEEDIGCLYSPELLDRVPDLRPDSGIVARVAGWLIRPTEPNFDQATLI